MKRWPTESDEFEGYQISSKIAPFRVFQPTPSQNHPTPLQKLKFTAQPPLLFHPTLPFVILPFIEPSKVSLFPTHHPFPPYRHLTTPLPSASPARLASLIITSSPPNQFGQRHYIPQPKHTHPTPRLTFTLPCSSIPFFSTTSIDLFHIPSNAFIYSSFPVHTFSTLLPSKSEQEPIRINLSPMHVHSSPLPLPLPFSDSTPICPLNPLNQPCILVSEGESGAETLSFATLLLPPLAFNEEETFFLSQAEITPSHLAQHKFPSTVLDLNRPCSDAAILSLAQATHHPSKTNFLSSVDFVVASPDRTTLTVLKHTMTKAQQHRLDEEDDTVHTDTVSVVKEVAWFGENNLNLRRLFDYPNKDGESRVIVLFERAGEQWLIVIDLENSDTLPRLVLEQSDSDFERTTPSPQPLPEGVPSVELDEEDMNISLPESFQSPRSFRDGEIFPQEPPSFIKRISIRTPIDAFGILDSLHTLLLRPDESVTSLQPTTIPSESGSAVVFSIVTNQRVIFTDNTLDIIHDMEISSPNREVTSSLWFGNCLFFTTPTSLYFVTLSASLPPQFVCQLPCLYSSLLTITHNMILFTHPRHCATQNTPPAVSSLAFSCFVPLLLGLFSIPSTILPITSSPFIACLSSLFSLIPPSLPQSFIHSLSFTRAAMVIPQIVHSILSLPSRPLLIDPMSNSPLNPTSPNPLLISIELLAGNSSTALQMSRQYLETLQASVTGDGEASKTQLAHLSKIIGLTRVLVQSALYCLETEQYQEMSSFAEFTMKDDLIEFAGKLTEELKGHDVLDDEQKAEWRRDTMRRFRQITRPYLVRSDVQSSLFSPDLYGSDLWNAQDEPRRKKLPIQLIDFGLSSDIPAPEIRKKKTKETKPQTRLSFQRLNGLPPDPPYATYAPFSVSLMAQQSRVIFVGCPTHSPGENQQTPIAATETAPSVTWTDLFGVEKKLTHSEACSLFEVEFEESEEQTTLVTTAPLPFEKDDAVKGSPSGEDDLFAPIWTDMDGIPEKKPKLEIVIKTPTQPAELDEQPRPVKKGDGVLLDLESDSEEESEVDEWNFGQPSLPSPKSPKPSGNQTTSVDWTSTFEMFAQTNQPSKPVTEATVDWDASFSSFNEPAADEAGPSKSEMDWSSFGNAAESAPQETTAAQEMDWSAAFSSFEQPAKEPESGQQEAEQPEWGKSFFEQVDSNLS
ncbi:hypothetical protein BLNAU_6532 [Blattamonas nauphoetae]|uniref:Uncharacterized protein n=1 Tax=Blattamonas nauphoetae TaxID=2049346 RepID=A0ABQ9Y429_9EUKA|nr:hypothetical protein BLNAU_6532 [Blattamonas nauphoetae]